MLSLLSSVAFADPSTPAPVTVGFGVGVVAPGSPLAPNVSSARIRLTDGFTLSPTAGYTYTTTVDETEGSADDVVTRDVDLSVGAEVLGVVARRGTALLQVVGGAEFAADTTTVAPDEPDELRTELRNFSLCYGLGVEWFPEARVPHVSLSAHGLNPLASVGRTVLLDETNSAVTSDTTSIGLVWDPSIRFMVHFYL